jgi:class 3 adenylate cyclase/tetratricopeptide (TPR) repeat protein
MPATAMVALLFCDLVGSTDILTRLGDDAADRVRHSFFTALREAVTTFRGTEVKNLGDGLMVAFTSAADAVSCATAMQQAMVRLNRRQGGLGLGLRIGLSVGEATCEEGDWFGTPVVEAARLCGSAEGGQILGSDFVRGLVGSRGGHQFRALGLLSLKGLPEPISAVEVAWVPPPAEVPSLPASLVPLPGGFFVGRDHELSRLKAAWKDAVVGTRRAVLVAGEPGIGKTRLASELAAEVHAEGAIVLYGRCEEELGVPYQPFAEAVRSYAATCPSEELVDHVDIHGGALARLVPELGRRLPDVPAPVQAEPEVERYLLFEAVAGLLEAASERAPVLLVLDDIHWAAKPTLLLMRHLLARAGSASLLVVGTYRDTELGRTHPLSETLADLRREQSVERLALAGLDEEGVAAFVEAAAGQALGARGQALARALSAETEGNPFFIGQVLRHLAETGAIYQHEGEWTYDGPLAQLAIPEGVREVVGRRLSRLSEQANRVLGIASVIGRDFDLDLIVRVSELSEAEVLAALEEAADARVVSEVPGVLDRYTFAHALVRETLHDELPTSRRVRLHRRVGEALEGMRAADIDLHLGQLAYHFGEAAEGGGAAKAVGYARRAAEAAMGVLAYEEAAVMYQRALDALDLDPVPDPRGRGDLLVGLGDARRGAGDTRGAMAACQQAAELARDIGANELLARAALAFDDATYWALGPFDQSAVAASSGVLHEALDVLGSGDTALHALVLARLARVLIATAPGEELRSYAERSRSIADRIGDDNLRVAALLGTAWATLGPDRPEERRAAIDELVRLTVQLGDRGREFEARTFALASALEIGDIGGVDHELEALRQLGEELRWPQYRYFPVVAGAMRALLAGRLDEAERLSFEAFSIGQEMQSEWALANLGAQLFTLRRYQGRLGDLEGPVRAQVAHYPQVTAWRCALAYLLMADHRLEEARIEFETLASHDFRDLPRDLNWSVSLFEMADVCHALGDTQRAKLLYELLRPEAALNIVVGPGVTCVGSASRSLGMLATTMGRWQEAEAHFEEALAFNGRLGAQPLVAFTLLAYARMLAARAGTGDLARARDLAAGALATAESLGLDGFTPEIRAVVAECEARLS